MNSPLVVDLDGTFIYGDMLRKDLARYVGISPLRLFLCACWLFKGRSHLKSRLAKLSLVGYSELKINKNVLDLILHRKAHGALIILMTGSDQKHANEVAKKSGLFDEVIASSGTTNMVGATKRRLLLERYGPMGFDYVGNSRRDIAVWKAARVSYATNLNVITGFLARCVQIELQQIDGDIV